jgi:hypothetical protein
MSVRGIDKQVRTLRIAPLGAKLKMTVSPWLVGATNRKDFSDCRAIRHT